MPLSNAQKQKDTRARRKAKLERLAVYEAALREIANLADRNPQSAFLEIAGMWARQALNPTTGDDA